MGDNEKLLKLLLKNDCLNVYGKGMFTKTYLKETDKEGNTVYFTLYNIDGNISINEDVDPICCINNITLDFKEENKKIITYNSKNLEISYFV